MLNIERADQKGKVIFDTTYNAEWLAGAWTAEADDDVITCDADHGLVVGDVVSFGAGTGTLPTGISAEPEYYYVVNADTTKTIKISLTGGGASINITADGTVGWQIRRAGVIIPTSPVPLDFTQYNEVDIYIPNLSYPVRAAGTGYLSFTLSTNCKVTLNHALVYGATAVANMADTSTKKYVILPLKMNIRKIATNLYSIWLMYSGLNSDNLDMSTPTALSRVYSGYVTGADITQITFKESYTSYLKNGIRIVVVRR